MLPIYNKVLEDSKFRLGTVTRMPSFASNLYTFHYRSITGNAMQPFVMLVQNEKSGNSIYQAKNGHRYMVAINLNYISSPDTRNLIIERLASRGPVTWKHALTVGRFFSKKSEKVFGAQNPGMYKPLQEPAKPGEVAGTKTFSTNAARQFIRQYDIRKLRDLSVVDAAKYLRGVGHTS